jgi:putative tryptophan/tyrosine transport system substrate-binding protein
MRRREVITLLGGAAAAWPLAAHAQQGERIRRIGFLSGRSPAGSVQVLAAFQHGLEEAGHAEGKNVTIEYRWAEGRYDRLPALALELVRIPVDIIGSFGGPVAARAAQKATTTIPIVFTTAEDPVESGLVASINRPGGNLTGVNFFSASLGGKRLEFLRLLLPNVTEVAVLVNLASGSARTQASELEEAGGALGLKIMVLNASIDEEIDAAFRSIIERRIGALVVSADPYFGARAERIVTLSAFNRVPSIYQFRDFVAAGGLMSYGASITDTYRQAGSYVARILKGERPAELPVLQPVKFEFVINLRIAKALGLDVPDKLLALTDEVIE